MEKIRVKEVIVVEGKYDKIKLSALVDGYILQTDGFRIFSDPDKRALLRRLAAARGVLVLTDSDSAGFVIRNYLNSILPKEQIRHAYIPDILGKEKRKAHASREGKLGVEGIDLAVLRESLHRAGVGEQQMPQAPITKQHLYEDGLTGGIGSAQLRSRLLKVLQLPENMTTNAMLQAMNSFLSLTEYKDAICQLKATSEGE